MLPNFLTVCIQPARVISWPACANRSSPQVCVLYIAYCLILCVSCLQWILKAKRCLQDLLMEADHVQSGIHKQLIFNIQFQNGQFWPVSGKGNRKQVSHRCSTRETGNDYFTAPDAAGFNLYIPWYRNGDTVYLPFREKGISSCNRHFNFGIPQPPPQELYRYRSREQDVLLHRFGQLVLWCIVIWWCCWSYWFSPSSIKALTTCFFIRIRQRPFLMTASPITMPYCCNTCLITVACCRSSRKGLYAEQWYLLTYQAIWICWNRTGRRMPLFISATAVQLTFGTGALPDGPFWEDLCDAPWLPLWFQQCCLFRGMWPPKAFTCHGPIFSKVRQLYGWR